MKCEQRPFYDLIPRFQNRDEFFQRLISDESTGKTVVHLYLILAVFAFLYGAAMGSYHSLEQAAAAGVKVVVLFTLALLICFPALYIIQFILGSRLKVGQMAAIILSGFVLTSAIMLSFIPIIVFFLLTGGNYYFLQLLHIGVFAFGGLFGLRNVIEALKYSCEEKSIYPQTGVTVFKVWIVIFAFVSMQLAWNLRPFLGDREEPFKLFRDYEGNFYTALIYSFKKLAEGDQESTTGTKSKNEDSSDYPLSLFPQDTTGRGRK